MDTPTWFTDAVDAPRDEAEVTVDGARIVYRGWGKAGHPPVVLVHGGAAHGGWWDHVGPHLVAENRVLSIDLSGHGDSDRRETYSLETWADEVLAVARAESDEPPIIFGHSMGGFVALTAGRDHGSELAGVVAIDSPVRELSPEVKEWLASGRDVPPNKIHPTREETEARFRTLPKDESSLEYVRRHIAAGSVREVAPGGGAGPRAADEPGGWSWKFDPHIFLRSQMEPEDLATTACPVALVRGERGMATTDITEVVKDRLGGHVPVTVVPDAGHHIMLDQPIALIALLQTLLGQWRAS